MGALNNKELEAFFLTFLESDGAGGYQLKTSIKTVVSTTSFEITNDIGNPIPVSSNTLASADKQDTGNTTLAGILLSVKKAVTGTTSRIAGVAASTTLLAANANRISAVIVNESTSTLYLKYGATASPTDYTFPIAPNGFVIIDDYTGRLDGIWSAAAGNAQITENT